MGNDGGAVGVTRLMIYSKKINGFFYFIDENMFLKFELKGML